MSVQPVYIYEVIELLKVVDGDTYDLVIDVGFRLHTEQRVRLLGWDTPELRRGSEYERTQGQRARASAELWLAGQVSRGELLVRTEKDLDNFGRFLAEPMSHGGAALGDHLSGQSLATPWPTRWRDVYDKDSS